MIIEHVVEQSCFLGHVISIVSMENHLKPVPRVPDSLVRCFLTRTKDRDHRLWIAFLEKLFELDSLVLTRFVIDFVLGSLEVGGER